MLARGLLAMALALTGAAMLCAVLLGVVVLRPTFGVVLLGIRALLCVWVLGIAWGLTRNPR